MSIPSEMKRQSATRVAYAPFVWLLCVLMVFTTSGAAEAIARENARTRAEREAIRQWEAESARKLEQCRAVRAPRHSVPPPSTQPWKQTSIIPRAGGMSKHAPNAPRATLPVTGSRTRWNHGILPAPAVLRTPVEEEIAQLAARIAVELNKVIDYANHRLDQIDDQRQRALDAGLPIPPAIDNKLRETGDKIVAEVDKLEILVSDRLAVLSAQSGIAVSTLRSMLIVESKAQNAALETAVIALLTRIDYELGQTSNADAETALTAAKEALRRAALFVDATAPTVAMSSPVSGSCTNQTNPPVAGTWSDALSGIDTSTARLLVDSVDLTASAVLTSGGFLLSLPAPLAQGNHTVLVEISEYALNQRTASVSFTVDITPPTISGPQPPNGGTVTSPRPTISASWSDDLCGIAPSTASILLDGASITAASTVGVSGFTFTPSTDLSGGSHTVTVTVSDAAGNTSSPFSWSFTVAVGSVTVIVPPTSSSTVVPVRVDFTGDGSTLRVLIDGVPLTGFMEMGTSSASATFDFAEGSHTIVATLGPADSPTATDSRTVLVDTRKPAISIARAGDSISVTYSDPNLALASLAITLDGFPVTGLTPGPGGVSFPVSVGTGIHSVTASIMDAAGNAATASFSFAIDTEAPTLVLNIPDGAIRGFNRPLIIATYADAVGVNVSTLSVKIDGIDLTRQFTVGPASASYTPPSGSPLSDGFHSLEATVRDFGGNGVTVQASFLVDTIAPQIAASPIPGARVPGRTPVLALTYFDRGSEGSGIDDSTLATVLNGTAVEFVREPGGARYLVTPDRRLPVGLNTLSATVSDMAGNSSTATTTFTIVDVPDTTLPTVALKAPVGDFTAGGRLITASNGTTVSIIVDASDASGIANVRMHRDGSVIEEATAPPYVFDFAIPDDGSVDQIVLQFSATDAASNSVFAPDALYISRVLPPAQGVPTRYEVLLPSSITAGDAYAVTIVPRDRDGLEVNAEGSFFMLRTTEGPVAFGIFTVQGRETFEILPPFTTARLHAIEAVGFDTFGVYGIATVPVVAAAPAAIVLDTPDNAEFVAGGQFYVQATILDAFGNPVIGEELRLEITQTSRGGVTTTIPLTVESGETTYVPVMLQSETGSVSVTASTPLFPAVPEMLFTSQVGTRNLFNIVFDKTVVQAGEPVSFRIRALDQDGYNDPGFNGTVYIYSMREGTSLDSASGGPYLTIDFAQSDGGVKYMQEAVVFNTAGAHILVASTVQLDMSEGYKPSHEALISSYSGLITVIPKPGALRIADPPGVIATTIDHWIYVQFQVVDEFGNGVFDRAVRVTIGTKVYDVRTDRFGFVRIWGPSSQGVPGEVAPLVFVQVTDPTDSAFEPVVTAVTPQIQTPGGQFEVLPPLSTATGTMVHVGTTLQAMADFRLKWNNPMLQVVDGAIDQTFVVARLSTINGLEGPQVPPTFTPFGEYFKFSAPPTVNMQTPGSPIGGSTLTVPLTVICNEPDPANTGLITLQFAIQVGLPVAPTPENPTPDPVSRYLYRLRITATGLPSVQCNGIPTTTYEVSTGDLAAIILGLSNNKIDIVNSRRAFEAAPNYEIYYAPISGGGIPGTAGAVHLAAKIEATRFPDAVALQTPSEWLVLQQTSPGDFGRPFHVEVATKPEYTEPTLTAKLQSQVPDTLNEWITPEDEDGNPLPEFSKDIVLTKVTDRIYRSGPIAVLDRPYVPALGEMRRVAGSAVAVSGPIRADGVEASRIVVQILNGDLVPVPGDTVSMELADSEPPEGVVLTPPSNPTDANGRTEGRLTSTKPGLYAVTVSAAGQTHTVNILVLPNIVTFLGAGAGRMFCQVQDSATVFLSPSANKTTETEAPLTDIKIYITSMSDNVQSVEDGAIRADFAVVRGIPPTPVEFRCSNLKPFWVDIDGNGTIEFNEISLDIVVVDDGLADTNAADITPESDGSAFDFNPLYRAFNVDAGPDQPQNFVLVTPLTPGDYSGILRWWVPEDPDDPELENRRQATAFRPGPNRITLIFTFPEASERYPVSARFFLYPDSPSDLGPQNDTTQPGVIVNPENHFELYFGVGQDGLPPTDATISAILRKYGLVPLGFNPYTGRLSAVAVVPLTADQIAALIEDVLEAPTLAPPLPPPTEPQNVRPRPRALERTFVARFDGAGPGLSPIRAPSVYEAPRGTTPFGGAEGTVNLHNGEFVLVEEDLSIPGIGLDWSHVRTYRSQIRYDGPMGHAWDFNYNMHLGERLAMDSGFPDTSAHGDIVFFTGTGRREIFRAQGDRYVAPQGFYLALDRLPGTTDPGDSQTNMPVGYIMRDPHKTEMRFAIVPTTKLKADVDTMSPSSDNTSLDLVVFRYFASLVSIRDRNGNELRFHYDTSMDLNPSPFMRMTRVELLNRPTSQFIDYHYDVNGRLVEIRDFTNRTVTFEYFPAGDANGNPGDLKKATGPAVTGTPTDNNFESGKSRSYTYFVTSTSSSELRHNLLSVQDGKGNAASGLAPILINQYGVAFASHQYDRVTNQEYGRAPDDTHGTFVFTYEPATNSTVERDRRTNQERWVFVGPPIAPGFATGAIAANAATPSSHVELATDAGDLTTTFQHNADTERTRVAFPRGNFISYQFVQDPPDFGTGLKRGNLREENHSIGTLPPEESDQGSLVTRYEYDPDFNFVRRVTRPRAGATQEPFTSTYEFDAVGNLQLALEPEVALGLSDTETTVSTVHIYNTRGQMTSRANPDGTSDSFEYHAATGYLIRSVRDFGAGTHLNLTTQYANDLVGNVTRVTDPRGMRTDFTVNQLNQVVRVIRGAFVFDVTTDYRYDANDNVVQVDADTQPTAPPTGYDSSKAGTSLRTVYEFDSLDNVTSETQTGTGGVAFTYVTNYKYDASENRTRVETPEGVSNNVVTDYNVRDLPQRVTRSGSSTRVDFTYDPNGNRATVRDGRLFTTSFTYDGFDRQKTVTDPSSTVATMKYDAHGNTRRVVVDGPDGHGGSATLRDSYFFYDNLDRMYGEAHEVLADEPVNSEFQSLLGVFPDDFVSAFLRVAVTTRSFDTMGRVKRIVNDKGHSTRHDYDTAGRLTKVTDAKDNFTQLTLDPNGNALVTIQHEVADNGSTQDFRMETDYDILNRATETRELGDSQTHTRRMYWDAGDRQIGMRTARGGFTYMYFDALGREVEKHTIAVDLGVPPIQANQDIRIRQEWDGNGRLRKQIDPNGHETVYAYDDNDRRTTTTYADGTMEQNLSFDANGNPGLVRDRRNALIDPDYDSLNRVERVRAGEPGLGISNDRRYQWDGLGRMTKVTEIDHDVTVAVTELFYDGLGRVISDTQNGVPVEATFDGVGNKLETRYPLGLTGPTAGGPQKRVARQYDSIRQMTQVRSSEAGYLGTFPIATYQYSGPGRPGFRQFQHNGVSLASKTTLYDGFRRVREVTHPGFVRVTRTYDADNNLAEEFLDDLNHGNSQENCFRDWRDDHVTDTAGRLLATRRRAYLFTPSGCPNTQFVRENYYDPAGNLVQSITDSQQRVSDAETPGLAPFSFLRTERTTTPNNVHEYRNVTTRFRETPSGPVSLSFPTTNDYDANGNVTKTDQYFISYDLWNRPTQVKQFARFGTVENHLTDVSDAGNNLFRIIDRRGSLGNNKWVGATMRLVYRTSQGAYNVANFPVVSNDSFGFFIDVGGFTPFRDLENNWDPRYEVTFTASPATQAFTIATYTYDGLNRRIQKTVSNSGLLDGTHHYLYDGFSIIRDQVTHPNGTQIANDYIWGRTIDEVVRMERYDASTGAVPIVTVFADLPNGTLARVSPAGTTTVEEYEVDTYGNATLKNAATSEVLAFSAFGTAIVWQGNYYDFETGFYYLRNRYYSPAMQRFIQVDPVGAFGDPSSHGNPYTFAGNNAATNSDPMGLLAPNLVAGFIGAAIGAAVGGYLGGTEGAIIGAASGFVGGFTFGLASASGLGIVSASVVSGVASGVVTGVASSTFQALRGERLTTEGVATTIATDAAVQGALGGGFAVLGGSVAVLARSVGTRIAGMLRHGAPKASQLARANEGKPWYNFLRRFLRRGNDAAFARGAGERGFKVLRKSAAGSSVQDEGGQHLITLEENPAHLDLLEEYVHGWQLRLARKQIGTLLQDISQRGIVKSDILLRRAAREIHAKAFLLRHAQTFGLTRLERTYLRLQLHRLWRYGTVRGY